MAAPVGVTEVLQALKECGIEIVVSVPDQWLGVLLDEVGRDPYFRHLAATREEEGVAICCGSLIGGRGAVMVMQNAGLLSSGTGITTLAIMHQLPLLMLISYRGEPGDPIFYHIPKGLRTEGVLRGLGVPYMVAGPPGEVRGTIREAVHYARAAPGPFAVLLTGKVFR